MGIKGRNADVGVVTMATANTEAAQRQATTALENTTTGATDETPAVAGEVAQTCAEFPQDNDTTETKTDETAQPNQNEGDKPEAAQVKRPFASLQPVRRVQSTIVRL